MITLSTQLKFSLILGVLLGCPLGHADLKILELKGAVTDHGKMIGSATPLRQGSAIELRADAAIEFVFENIQKQAKVFGPAKFVLTVDQPGEVEVQIEKGRFRFKGIPSKVKFKVHTKTAVMGVRGTEFMVQYDALLEESETVVFEGKIEFASKILSGDVKEIGAGQWGGVGGRFGQKIGPLITLPEPVLKTFKDQTAINRSMTK